MKLTRVRKERIRGAMKLAFLLGLTFLMLYPLLWMFFGTFKDNVEIFDYSHLIPYNWQFSNYSDAWTAIPGYTIGHFMLNSLVLSTAITIGTVLSCVLAAYPIARLQFRGKSLVFGIVIASLILPTQVLLIPRFLMFTKMGWTNSYKPLIVPAFFCQVYGAFSIYMLVNFMKGIPDSLEEAAVIDGCGLLKRLVYIIIPNSKPAIFTIAIFSFIWSWDNFLDQLIYLNDIDKYTITLALRMFNDNSAVTNWGQLFAVSIISIIPVILIYACAQKYFVEGIATTGLK